MLQLDFSTMTGPVPEFVEKLQENKLTQKARFGIKD